MIVATHLAIKIRPALTLDRHLTSDSSNFLEINRSKGNANSLLHLSSHNSPGIDNHGVPIAASLRVVLTCLRRRYHVALCLDGSRPEQGLPMCLTSGNCECRREGEKLSSSLGQSLTVLTEPQVIADSETKLAKRSLYRRGHTSTRYHIITFLQTELARHASVKEMGFGIGGNNIPLSIDQNVSVASFLALSGSDMETSKTQPEPVFHCHLSECRHCGAC